MSLPIDLEPSILVFFDGAGRPHNTPVIWLSEIGQYTPFFSPIDEPDFFPDELLKRFLDAGANWRDLVPIGEMNDLVLCIHHDLLTLTVNQRLWLMGELFSWNIRLAAPPAPEPVPTAPCS